MVHSCDVLVIGAGIAGASAAYELAPYASVILLERERQPGYHTTGRSAAVFAPAYGNRVIRALTLASHSFYQARAGGLAAHPVLTPRGALFIARADQEASLARLLAETAPQIKGLERLDRDQLLARLPDGALRADLPRRAGEGMALVEGFRGDVLAWVRVGNNGRVERCHLRDPSWFQWPLLEAVIEGNIVADFPLCNKSFNCSYSGHDL